MSELTPLPLLDTLKATCQTKLEQNFADFEAQTPSSDTTLVNQNIKLLKELQSEGGAKGQDDVAPLMKAIHEVFREGVNSSYVVRNTSTVTTTDDSSTTTGTSYAEILCNVLDSGLRSGFKEHIEDLALLQEQKKEQEKEGQQREEEEDSTAATFSYLDQLGWQFSVLKEKDVFLELFELNMADRLLGSCFDSNRSFSYEAEQHFIEVLSNIMGSSYVHKLTPMLNQVSAPVGMDDENPLNEPSSGVGFDCRFMAATTWPEQTAAALTSGPNQAPWCPMPSLGSHMQRFTLQYTQRHPERELKWIHHLGRSTLTIKFPRGTKEVTLGTFQAHVLVCVDVAGSLSGQQIAGEMGLSSFADLKPHLASLYLSKLHNMLCHGTQGSPAASSVQEAGNSSQKIQALPPTKEKLLDPGTTYRLNPAYLSKNRKLKIGAPGTTAAGCGGSSASSQKKVDMEKLKKRREAQVDSAIVRTLLQCSTLNTTELRNEVTSQLEKSFTIERMMFTRRIEELISRLLIRRNPDDAAMLEYLP